MVRERTSKAALDGGQSRDEMAGQWKGRPRQESPRTHLRSRLDITFCVPQSKYLIKITSFWASL